VKKILLIIIVLSFIYTSTASADWRWSSPQLKKQTAVYHCSTFKCIRKTYLSQRKRLKHRIYKYNTRRLVEWKKWISAPIADCTWAGESSPPGDYTGQFASYRYTVLNSQGSDARGKYQMMPDTYSSYAKYGDWSPLDQEIAGHKLYADQGIYPWKSCTG
jgi:hypothetical protein